MLTKIYIKNFALLEELEISFHPGFNVLTGETGAGKSLVINALNSILGEKVSTDILRNGANKAIVEGSFETMPNHVREIINNNDLDQSEHELLLRRELNQSGRSRTFINDGLAQIDVLKQISTELVDLHGQHEHQSLLHDENHVRFLSEFGSLRNDEDKIGRQYSEILKLQSKLDYLKKNAQQLKEKKDFLQFQIHEIESLHLEPTEEEELIKQEKILENHEKLFGGCNDLFSNLYEDDNSVYSSLDRARETLEELTKIDSSFTEYLELLSNSYMQVEEVARFINQYVSKKDFDPNRLEDIRVRLSQLSGIKKKYGLPISDILEKQKTMKEELDQIENLDEALKVLKDKISKQKDQIYTACLNLSASRKKVAKKLEQNIVSVLHQIGMENATFKVHFDVYSKSDESGIEVGENCIVKANGFDKVAFFVSTNPGASLKPLAKIASGGELSRIMLAIKAVMAEKDQIGVLVFDEIDIGISGRIAEAVGKKLKELSTSHQIICVTHLPQIARFADKHYSVRKEVKNGETFAFIQELNFKQRIHELAYLLGGEKITDVVLKNAEELLESQVE